MLDNLPLQNNEGEKLGSTSTQGQNERSPGRKSEKDSQDSDGSRKNLPSNDERKRKYDEVYRDSEMSSKASGDRLSDGRDSRLETQTAKDARKRKYSNDGHGSEGSGGDKQSDGGHPEGDHYGSIPYNSPSYVTDVRPLGEGQPSRCFEMPSHGGFTDKGDLDFVRSSNIEFRTASAEVQSLIPGDMGWASGTRGKSPVEEQSGGMHQGADIYFGDVRRSPPNLLDRSSTEVHTSGYPSISGSHRTAFGGTQLSAIDEMERRFSQSNTDPYGSYRYSGVNTAEQFMGRGRGTADNRGYRSSGDVDLDIRSQLALYGQDPAAASDPIFSQLESLPSSASTLHLGSSAPASYRNMSVMQRYTPQLHDLNSPMTSNYRFEPQMQVLNPHVSNNFRFDPPQPQMGDLNYFNDPMGLAPSYPADPFATAPAPAPPPPPPYPFSHPGFSPGWIND